MCSKLNTFCASGSVGRAQPCQGWGRGFESRLALFLLLWEVLKNGASQFFLARENKHKFWLHLVTLSNFVEPVRFLHCAHQGHFGHKHSYLALFACRHDRTSFESCLCSHYHRTACLCMFFGCSASALPLSLNENNTFQHENQKRLNISVFHVHPRKYTRL